MKINERIVRLTIEKFSDCLDYCYYSHLPKDDVINFFGKKRAEKWCGRQIGAGYPDMKLIQWYEERYDKEWHFPPRSKFYNGLRFLLPWRLMCWKNC